MRIKDARKPAGTSTAARGLVFVAVVALVGAVALSITGGLGSAIADLGHSLGGLVGGIAGASASPTSSGDLGVEGAPRLDVPVNPWTDVGAWDVKGLLPNGVAGSTTLKLRVYVGTVQAADVPVPQTADFVVPAVPLQPGWNEISAAILDTNGEGPRSAAIKVNFDDQPPVLTISSPKDGSKTSASKVTVSGKTQASSTIAVRNELTGAAANTLASPSGAFKIDIDIDTGSNALSITATDPAGNATAVVVTVKRGGGDLTATLSLSAVRIPISSLPKTLVITLTVTDVGGAAVNGAQVVFTISPPGRPTETKSTTTVNGKAKWSVPIQPSGTIKASGFVTARVTLKDGRVVSTSTGFTVV